MYCIQLCLPTFDIANNCIFTFNFKSTGHYIQTAMSATNYHRFLAMNSLYIHTDVCQTYPNIFFTYKFIVAGAIDGCVNALLSV